MTGSWPRVVAVAVRHARVLQRSPHRLFDVALWPLVDTLLFASITVAFNARGSRAVEYVLSGIVLWHVVYQAQVAVSTGFLEETWSRNLLSLMVTPMREWEYVAGVALFGLVKLVGGAGVVALTCAVLYSFDVLRLGLPLVPVVGLLMLAGWAIALAVIGLVLRYGSGAEALAWGIVFVVLPLSGSFYPVSALPGFLQPVAQVLPTTHAFTAARLLVDGRSAWAEIGLSAVLTVVAAAAALAYVGWMLRLFRSRGYVTRYS